MTATRTVLPALESSDVFVDFSTGIGGKLFHIVLGGDPASKSRPRFNGNGKQAYTEAKTTTAQDSIGWRVKAALKGNRPVDGHELTVHIKFFCATRQRRDIDNMAKLVLDACNGVLWGDDAQVAVLNVSRERGVGGAVARTELTVFRGEALV